MTRLSRLFPLVSLYVVLLAALINETICAGFGPTIELEANATNTTGSDDSLTHRAIIQRARHVEVAPGIIAAIAICTGSVVCVAGYRLFRPTLGVCGFLLAGLVGTFFAEQFFSSHPWSEGAHIVSFVLFGCVGCWIVLRVYTFGIFAIGATGGVFIAYTLQPTVAPYLSPENPQMMLALSVIALGLLGGGLTLYLERPMLIICTSYAGAHSAIWGIGYFAGGFPDPNDIRELEKRDHDGHIIYAIPRAWWAYLAVIIVCFVLGLYIQFFHSSVNHDHRQHGEKQNMMATNVKKGETKEPNYGAAVVHV